MTQPMRFSSSRWLTFRRGRCDDMLYQFDSRGVRPIGIVGQDHRAAVSDHSADDLVNPPDSGSWRG